MVAVYSGRIRLLVVNEAKGVAEMRTGEAKCLNGMAIELGNRKAERITNGVETNEVNKLKRKFKGKEFELKFTSDTKKKANREARKYHRRGFHSRVIEMYSGDFLVYRRAKKAKQRIPQLEPITSENFKKAVDQADGYGHIPDRNNHFFIR